MIFERLTMFIPASVSIKYRFSPSFCPMVIVSLPMIMLIRIVGSLPHLPRDSYIFRPSFYGNFSETVSFIGWLVENFAAGYKRWLNEMFDFI